MEYRRNIGFDETINLIKTKYFCPKCAKKKVWMAEGEGDYYTGVEHFCSSCEHAFYLPYGVYEIPRLSELIK